MDNKISEFMKHAKDLTKNPLGIIALFISLIYGFACLVLGVGSENLDKDQRWPLVYFLVIFPIMILASFMYLVVKHNKKLYGPSDFRDEDNFIKTLNLEAQAKRIDNEAKGIIEEIEEGCKTLPIGEQANKKDKDNSLETEYKCINDTIGYSYSRAAYARQMYTFAEDLVLRQLEIELNTSIKRQVEVNTEYGKVEFDGIAIIDNHMFGIEVKYTQRGSMAIHTMKSIRMILNSLTPYSKSLPKNAKFTFILVIVHDDVSVERLNLQKQEILDIADLPIEIRFYNINELKRKFGLEKDAI